MIEFRIQKKEELTIVISGKVEKWQETLLTIWWIAWTFCGGYVLYSILGDYNRDEKLVMFIYLIFWLYFEVKLSMLLLGENGGRGD